MYFLKGDPEVVEIISDKDLTISFVTELELLSFPKLTNESEADIKGLLNNCTIIELKQEIKELTIEFRKRYRLKLPDSIIAASAYFHKLPLITADKEFHKLEEMNIILYENE
ncbi:Putative nucleic acid-binding protein [Fulvivirga imtechensis AK7]|uniref:Putative nucleic acid-binding protein n=1 Tax=Fulvivirga imtechensis AK7 TaxID=1237149 RepID=L8JKX2_9BACT|nr:type II toxin-antitoxin system VapC family toxin [Fulvivirga imtechensis]ELR68863.1 Putative nucleic acid-binding protein [Fulvivirga imtechensis AK7]